VAFIIDPSILRDVKKECLSGGFLHEGRGAVKGYEGDKSFSLRHVFDIWQGGFLTGKFVHGFISYREER